MLDVDDNDDGLPGNVSLPIDLQLRVHVSLCIIGFLHNDIDDIGITD